MKKLYLGLLVLASTSLLAGCNGNKDFLIKEGKPVLTEELIRESFGENNAYEEPNRKVTASDVVLPDGCTISTPYFSKGLVVVLKDGKYGVFSVFGKKMIVSANLDTEPTIEDDSMSGALIIYEYSSVTHIVDGHGNDLLATLGTLSAHGLTYRRYNDKLYSTLSYMISSSSTMNKYYEYADNGIATSIDELPNVYKEKEPSIGSQYTDSKIDLRSVGLDRYVLQSGNAYQVYSTSGEKLGGFELPSDITGTAFIGKSLFYQRQIQVDENARQYTYMTSGYIGNTVKMKLITKTIDLSGKTFKAKDIDVNWVGTAAPKQIINKDGGTEYLAVKMKEIRSDKSLGAERIMVMDEKCKFHEDLTLIGTDFTKLSDGSFYASGSNTIFDKEYQPVFNAETLTFNYAGEYFYGTKTFEGKNYEVIVSKEGKYLTDLKYDAGTYSHVYGGTVRLERDGKYYYVCTDTSSVEFEEINEANRKLAAAGPLMISATSSDSGVTWSRETFNSHTLEDIDSELGLTSMGLFYAKKLSYLEKNYYVISDYMIGTERHIRLYSTGAFATKQ